MTLISDSKKLKKELNLIDLCEDVLHEIFRYFDYHYTYLNLRNVCNRFRCCVDRFMQLGGIFMLIERSNPFEEVLKRRSSELIYAYKQNGNLVSIRSKPTPPLPDPDKDRIRRIVEDEILKKGSSSTEIGTFGHVINGKIIAGVCYKECYETKVEPYGLIERLRNRGTQSQRLESVCRIVIYLYEYQIKRNRWLPALPLKSNILGIYNDTSIDCQLFSCELSDSILIGLFIGSENRLDGLNRGRIDYKIVKLKLHVAKEGYYSYLTNSKVCIENNRIYDNHISSMTYSMTFLDRPKMTFRNEYANHYKGFIDVENFSLPNESWNVADSSFGGYSMINIGENKIFLDLNGQFEFNTQIYKKLWQDSIKEHKLDIIWRKIPLQSDEPFWQRIYLKLKNNIYIIGNPVGKYGLIGDRYNLDERKYYPSDLMFPETVCSVDTVAIDEDETFAIILGTNDLARSYREPRYLRGRRNAQECIRNSSYTSFPCLMILTEANGLVTRLNDTDLMYGMFNEGSKYSLTFNDILLRIK